MIVISIVLYTYNSNRKTLNVVERDFYIYFILFWLGIYVHLVFQPPCVENRRAGDADNFFSLTTRRESDERE